MLRPANRVVLTLLTLLTLLSVTSRQGGYPVCRLRHSQKGTTRSKWSTNHTNQTNGGRASFPRSAAKKLGRQGERADRSVNARR